MLKFYLSNLNSSYVIKLTLIVIKNLNDNYLLSLFCGRVKTNGFSIIITNIKIVFGNVNQ